MIPHNRDMVTRLKGKPFTLLGIDSDPSRSALQKIVEKEQINYPNIYDGPVGEGQIATQWNVMGWPTIYVLDHEGVIRYRDLRDEGLERAVNELVAKVPAR